MQLAAAAASPTMYMLFMYAESQSYWKYQAYSLVTNKSHWSICEKQGLLASFSECMAGLRARNALPLDRSHTTSESNKESAHMLLAMSYAEYAEALFGQ